MSEEKILRFDFKEAVETMKEDDPQSVAESMDVFVEDIEDKINSMIGHTVKTISVNNVNIVESGLYVSFDTSSFGCNGKGDIGMHIGCGDDHALYVFDAESAVVTVKKDSRYPELLTIKIADEAVGA